MEEKAISEVPKTSLLKRDQVQNFSRENEFYLHDNKNHFHNKGFALDLVLKQRLEASRKWSIACEVSRFLISTDHCGDGERGNLAALSNELNYIDTLFIFIRMLYSGPG